MAQETGEDTRGAFFDGKDQTGALSLFRGVASLALSFTITPLLMRCTHSLQDQDGWWQTAKFHNIFTGYFRVKHAEDEFCANVLRKILSLKRIPQFNFKDRKGFNNDSNEFTAHSCNHTPTIQKQFITTYYRNWFNILSSCDHSTPRTLWVVFLEPTNDGKTWNHSTHPESIQKIEPSSLAIEEWERTATGPDREVA